MDNHVRDEQTIKKLISEKRFLPFFTRLNDIQLVSELVKKLESHFQGKAVIVTLTAGPGAGKSTLREHLIDRLERNGHTADYISTDDFGLYTREERNRLIAEGKINPWTAKDWVLLNKLVDEVREGKSVKAPVYDEATGDAVVVGETNFPHTIKPNLHFFIIEGDFQPIENVDVQIYFHVPTDVRRENRVVRDMAKRNGGDSEKIRQSFDFRLESQYYPYTIPNAEKADMLIVADAQPSKRGEYPFIYSYSIYKKS